MLYLFKVYALVATLVFGLSGVVMLTMYAFQEARQYAHARIVMSQIATGRFREPIAISRTNSRVHEDSSLHAA